MPSVDDWFSAPVSEQTFRGLLIATETKLGTGPSRQPTLTLHVDLPPASPAGPRELKWGNEVDQASFRLCFTVFVSKFLIRGGDATSIL